MEADYGETKSSFGSNYAGMKTIIDDAKQVAMRTGNVVRYVFADHLGSATVTADANGGNGQRQLYKGWGETRSATSVATEYAYTGQYAYDGANELGLLYYRARWYDPNIAQFPQPDTLVPDQYNSLDWNRRQYSRANPLKFTDPTGHWPSLSKILSIGATICDIGALAISMAGIVVEGVAAMGGEMLTPVPGVDGAAGFAAGIAAYNGVLNPIENGVSTVSLVLVAVADAVDKNHKLGRVQDPITGQEATRFELGADTTYSLASNLIGGNAFTTPDAVTDSLANITTIYYDLTRLKGNEPKWGLLQLQIVKPDYSPGYFQVIKIEEDR